MTLTRRQLDGAVVYAAICGGEELGYVAVDSTVRGRACGGLRMLHDVTADELRALARSMTLKFGLLGLPQGGAKAGVRADPDAPPEWRLAALCRFARQIAPLLRSRAYLPGRDMGTTSLDVRRVLRAAGVRVGRREQRPAASGYWTALSVAAAAAAAMRRRGLDLRGRTAAIEGFGGVGAPLAGLLAEAGAKVVAVSTSHGALYDPRGLDVDALARLAARAGSRAVELCGGRRLPDPSDLLELPVDLLCPCARSGSIGAGNVERVRAGVVCPGANNPLTPDAEQALARWGVLCVPDFLANCGGVLGGTMEFAAVAPPRIAATIGRYVFAAVEALLRRAEREGVAPRGPAEDAALRRHREVKQRAERPSLAGRALSAAVVLHRHGLLPPALVGAAAPAYFERRLADMVRALA